MHPLAVRELVAEIRKRVQEGDHPITPPQSRETLEHLVVALADDLKITRLKLKIALDPDDAECEAGVLHPEAPAANHSSPTGGKP